VLLLGLLCFRHYGVATDEGTMDALGMATEDYVFRGAKWPDNPAWMYHGTVVEFPLQIIEGFFAERDDVQRTYLRILAQHFSVFLLFFFGLAMLYLLAKKRFRDWRWALLSCLFLLLTPRFFAHAFYNSRDIPTMVFFLAAIYTLVRLLERRTILRTVLHAFATAVALALRMPALILIVITLLFVALDSAEKWRTGNALNLKRTGLLCALYLACVPLLTIMLWPFLWEHPLQHFLAAYRFMSSFEGNQLFLGHTYQITPWHYIPLWMAVTIPVVFSVFFAVGLCILFFSFGKSPRTILAHHRLDLLFLAWFFLPLLSIFLKGASIYTEWRHVYFLYPAFLLIAVGGIRSVAGWIAKREGRLKLALGGTLAGLVALQLLSTGIWMIRNHPLEFAYFSVPPRWAQAVYAPNPPDYWGLSYREAMRVLLQSDSGIVSVYSPDNTAYQNAYNVFPQSLGRLMRVPTPAEAMYIVTRDPRDAEGLPLLHPIAVDGMLLSGVYKGPVTEVRVDTEKGTVEFH
jgi:hypothetical protein